MPLDTGDVEVGNHARLADDGLVSLRPTPVQFDEKLPIGSALAAARLSLDLAVEDVASATRVSSRYIVAIEEFDFKALPARPFVIGYVRAYAMALGLDADAVVARFRAEAPAVADDLRAPVGVERPIPVAPRIIGFAACMVVTAVVAWNIWRHAEAQPLRSLPPPPVAVSAAPGPVAVGAPPPTPPEASTPPHYETPGLPDPDGSAASPPAKTASAQGLLTPAAQPGAPFKATGAVYGAPGSNQGLVLEARTPTTLIVHGPDGAVYFARQLAAGEAWRAPAMDGLTVDADTPSAIEVFVGGALRGVLAQSRAPVSKLLAG
ncbi:MAG: helix-turn-helix domain-containing protein [Caulobacteraceae bacterium]|nr:helix-turn-helix domain-containing protein [Caulobacteraceae bacterium]